MGSVAERDTSESLEAFVARLHEEGVEAGREEAERLVRRAREEADAVVRAAEERAAALVAEAEERAKRARARGRDELELAARDAVLSLQAALAETLTRIWTRGVSAELSDEGVVASLLGELVRGYASADAAGRPTEVRIPPRLVGEVEAWWSRELARSLEAETALVGDPLVEAGFEYRVGGGTVEVTVDSVVEKVMELVQPRLRELVSRAAGGPAPADGESAALAGAGTRSG